MQTATVTLSAYFTGIRSGDLGTAAAMTVVLLVTVLISTTILLRILAWASARRSRRDLGEAA